MKVGYARVSTQDQRLDLQRQALTAAGCSVILEDQTSGRQVKRPGPLRQQLYGRTVVASRLLDPNPHVCRLCVCSNCRLSLSPARAYRALSHRADGTSPPGSNSPATADKVLPAQPMS